MNEGVNEELEPLHPARPEATGFSCLDKNKSSLTGAHLDEFFNILAMVVFIYFNYVNTRNISDSRSQWCLIKETWKAV